MNLQFCVNLTFLLNEYETLSERCKVVKRLGFEGVEFAFPPHDELDSTAAAIRALSLRLVLVNIATHDDHPFGCAAVAGQQANFRNNLLRTIAFAKQTNCDKVHLMAGLRYGSTDTSFENQLAVYEENLRMAADLLASEHMIGLIEPISSDIVPAYFLNNYELAIAVLKRIKKKNLRLQLDIFHLQKIKGNLTQWITEYLPFVSHIQIAQLPDRNEPFACGELNFNYIFQLLQTHNYSEWIGLEFRPSRRSENILKKFTFI